MFYQSKCSQGTPCDLITGEERRHASLYSSVTNPGDRKFETPDEDNMLQHHATELTASNHVACTVEMTSLNSRCELICCFYYPDSTGSITSTGRGLKYSPSVYTASVSGCFFGMFLRSFKKKNFMEHF